MNDISLNDYYFLEDVKYYYKIYKIKTSFKEYYIGMLNFFNLHLNQNLIEKIWNDKSKYYITVGFRLNNINIKDLKYTKLINLYSFKKSDMEELLNLPEKEKFIAIIIPIIILKDIKPYLTSKFKLPVGLINILNFYFISLFEILLNEFDYNIYKKDYIYYLSEFLDEPLDLFIDGIQHGINVKNNMKKDAFKNE